MDPAATIADVLHLDETEIIVLDARGRIAMVNQAFAQFGRQNGLSDPASLIGQDYVAASRPAATDGDLAALDVVHGIEALLRGEAERFEVVYPCHSPSERRWFRVIGRRLVGRGAVLYHQNVTASHVAANAIARVAMGLPIPDPIHRAVDLTPYLWALAHGLDARGEQRIDMLVAPSMKAMVDPGVLCQAMAAVVIRLMRAAPDGHVHFAAEEADGHIHLRIGAFAGGLAWAEEETQRVAEVARDAGGGLAAGDDRSIAITLPALGRLPEARSKHYPGHSR